MPRMSVHDMRQLGSSIEAADRDIVVTGIIDTGGGFGAILKGRWRGMPVAIKIQLPRDTPLKSKAQLLGSLEWEYVVYKDIQLSPYSGFPTCYVYGRGDTCNYLVMDRMGTSLSGVHDKFPRGFTLETCCMIAIQVIDHLKVLHDTGYVHRDIKPGNLVLGYPSKKDLSYIYLIDFGLSKAYVDEQHNHYPPELGDEISGSLKYMGVDAMVHKYPSRRDDIQALAYTLIFFFQKHLPWERYCAKQADPEKHRRYRVKARESKLKHGVDGLCLRLPSMFGAFLEYSLALQFKEKPNYSYMKSIFLSYFHKEGKPVDFMEFDWITNRRVREDLMSRYSRRGHRTAR